MSINYKDLILRHEKIRQAVSQETADDTMRAFTLEQVASLHARSSGEQADMQALREAMDDLVNRNVCESLGKGIYARLGAVTEARV